MAADMAESIIAEELFERLDVQRCGQILISDALRALREVNPDLETNAGVQAIIESMGGEEEAVDLTQLSDFIKALEGVNQKENSKKVSISDADIKKVFRLVDVDKSGCISRTEARMASKLLSKKFGIKDTTAWIKEQDEDNDGRLNYKEFKSAVRAEIERLNAGE